MKSRSNVLPVVALLALLATTCPALCQRQKLSLIHI